MAAWEHTLEVQKRDERTFSFRSLYTPTSILVLIVLIALIERVALLVLLLHHGYDSFAYQDWAWHLIHKPLSDFYQLDLEVPADHLPGDLWILWILGNIFERTPMIGHAGIYSSEFTTALGLVVALFDFIASLAIWRTGCALGMADRSRNLAFAYWASPVVVFVASGWGQTDGISVSLAIVAICMALRGRFSLSFLVLSVTAITKPQFALLFLPILIGWIRQDGAPCTAWFRRIASTVIACLGIVAIIGYPFGVSLFGGWGQWTVLDRLQVASDRYQISVLGAHNFWGLWHPLNRAPDDRIPWILGVSRQSVGYALLAGVMAFAIWILLARWRGMVTLVISSNILMLGFFLFMTRMHERYMFPVVGLSILLAMLDLRFVRYAIAINALCFCNIYLRFAWTIGSDSLARSAFGKMEWAHRATIPMIMSVLTLLAFGWLMWQSTVLGKSGRSLDDLTSE